MPNRSGHHPSQHAAPDEGLPAGPPTAVNVAQTTDLAGNSLLAQPANGPCTTGEARASQAQCRTMDAAGFPVAPLACMALACATLAAGLWILAGKELRAWIDGQGWNWRPASRATTARSPAARALRRRRHLGLGIVALALGLGIVSLIAGQPG